MGTSKAKPVRQIYVYSRIFGHIQVYSGIIHVYLGIFRTLCKPDIFRTLPYIEPEAYSGPWYIQNPGMLRAEAYTYDYREIVNSYNGYFLRFSHFCNITLHLLSIME